MGETRLNILWVVMDAFRTANLDCYGYPKQTAPTISKLAARSTLFENMIASGIPSPPAAATMLSGLFTLNHEHVGFEDTFFPKVLLLPDHCKAHGYDSVAVLSNPLFHKSSAFNRFDDFVDMEDILAGISDCRIKNPSSKYKHSLPRSEDLVPIATDRLEKLARKRNPFCLFLWFMDTHENHHLHFPPDDPIYEGISFNCNKPDDGYNFLNFDLDIYRRVPQRIAEIKREYSVVYDGEVKYFDQQFALILRKLDELELIQNTIVLLLGDHGTAFYEHGHFGHRYANLYEEVVRVPCILHIPRQIGQRIAAQTRTIDLLPTVLDCAGIPVPPGMDGISLKPVLGGAALELDFPSPLLFAWPVPGEPTEYVVGYREWPWKLVADLRPGGGEYLYNLEWDPGEATNLRHRHDCRDTVKALWGKLRAHYEKCGKAMPRSAEDSSSGAATSSTPAMTPELQRRLELLGYL